MNSMAVRREIMISVTHNVCQVKACAYIAHYSLDSHIRYMYISYIGVSPPLQKLEDPYDTVLCNEVHSLPSGGYNNYQIPYSP